MLRAVHLLLMLQSAFSLWMLYDASQRRVASYWYFVILIPFGELVYFFAVKTKADPKLRSLVRKLSERPASLAELEALAAEVPSQVNKLRLAQGLHDAGRMAEAAEGFRGVLQRDDESKEALYGLAMSCISSTDDSGAVDALEKLVAVDIGYQDFAPGAELSALLWRKDRRDEALAMMKKVSRRSHRFEHEVQYAMFLMESGSPDEAKELLESGLTHHVSGPAFAKKQDAVWAKRARVLLDKCN
jgi:hypothetical protein